MRKPTKCTAQVHRFGDFVAGYLADGSTVYMTPDDAIAFANALLDAAEDCKKWSYLQSTFNTKMLDFGGN